jgi:DnaJ-class molecular chaperone
VIKNAAGKVIKPGKYHNNKLNITLIIVSVLDSVYQVAGEGMPIKGSMERGKLYVVFDVEFPEPHFLTEDGFKVRI